MASNLLSCQERIDLVLIYKLDYDEIYIFFESIEKYV